MITEAFLTLLEPQLSITELAFSKHGKNLRLSSKESQEAELLIS